MSSEEFQDWFFNYKPWLYLEVKTSPDEEWNYLMGDNM